MCRPICGHILYKSLYVNSDLLYGFKIRNQNLRSNLSVHKIFTVRFHTYLGNIIGNISESSNSNTMGNIRLLVVTMLFAKIVHSRFDSDDSNGHGYYH